ncbi:hypothetical protein ACWEWU_09340 [Staphylococcus xylosus]
MKTLLRKLFKRKDERWVDVWYGDQWLKVKEDNFLKCIIVKDSEGNLKALKVK